jgi:hypothetical protein
MALDAIRLRQATAADAEFIYRLVETTMRGYVEQIWGSFSEEYNRKNIAESIGAGTYSLIEHEGLDIGALAVERHSTHIVAPEPRHRHFAGPRAGARGEGNGQAAPAACAVRQPGSHALRAGRLQGHLGHARAGIHGVESIAMIFLFTDFGAADLYVGQVKRR